MHTRSLEEVLVARRMGTGIGAGDVSAVGIPDGSPDGLHPWDPASALGDRGDRDGGAAWCGCGP
jgi:hypothetical protein